MFFCSVSIGSNDAAVRVHPQFLHANATSHKWALGALAELLDNSLDEVLYMSFYVFSIDASSLGCISHGRCVIYIYDINVNSDVKMY